MVKMRGGGGDMEAFYGCDFFTHKFSPGQPCRGVSHHVCVGVKFTLKLILGHNAIYVL
jgi:hypothetical protein